MEENDPWLSNAENNHSQHKCEFEDNFVDKIERLPDSDAYLATLERKLSKIKKTGGITKKDQRDLLNSLEDSRKSCMYRLIAGETGTGTDDDVDLDAPVNFNSTTGWLKSQVNPEQPVTVGELVELVKADYLANQTTEQEVIEDPS